MILAFLFGIPFAWWIAILALLFIADIICFACEAYGWSIFIMTASIAGAIWLDHSAASSWVAANLHQILLYYIPGYLAAGLGTALVKWILYAAKRVGWIKEAKTQFDAKKFDPEKPDFEVQAKRQVPGLSNDLYVRNPTDIDKAKLAEAQKTYVAEVARVAAELEAKWTESHPSLKRAAFVEFYKRGIRDGAFGGYSSHTIYEADFTKETSVVDALSPRAKDNIGKITIWIYQWPVVIVASLIEDFLIKLAKNFAKALDAMFSKIVRDMVAKATKGL